MVRKTSNSDYSLEGQRARELHFNHTPRSGGGMTAHGDMRDEWFNVEHKSTGTLGLTVTVGMLRKLLKDAKESGLLPLLLIDLYEWDELWVAFPIAKAKEFAEAWLAREQALSSQQGRKTTQERGDARKT